MTLEGIFMFGGVYGKINNRKVNDKLMFMPIGKDVDHTWRQVKTNGHPPKGRFHH